MKYAIIILGLALLIGCRENGEASAPSTARPSSVPVAEDTQAFKTATARKRPAAMHGQASGSIYHALVGEIAIRRNQWDTALNRYLMLSETLDDPAVAERLTRLAIQSGQSELALDAATFWANHDLNNAEAQWISASILIKADREDDALPFLEHLLTIQPDNAEESFLYIASMMETDEEQQDLLHQLQHLAEKAPNDFHALLTIAMLTQTWGDPSDALPMVNQILYEHPYATRAIALRVKLLPLRKGLNYLKALRKAQPDNNDIRLIYAQQLTETRSISLARAHFHALTDSPAHRAPALESLAMIALQDYRLNKASEYLNDLKTETGYTAMAHFYLGLVAEEQGNIKEAIQFYDTIEPSEFYLRARIRAADLLAEYDSVEAARGHLQNSTVMHGEDQKYLYLMEAQLLINADRTDSAISLLNRALSMTPNDPALLATKGWAYFQIDQNNNALTWLRKAYAEQPDAAIAARLGEVLWTNGDEAAAQTIWDEAYQQDPRHPVLQETLYRFSK